MPTSIAIGIVDGDLVQKAPTRYASLHDDDQAEKGDGKDKQMIHEKYDQLRFGRRRRADFVGRPGGRAASGVALSDKPR